MGRHRSPVLVGAALHAAQLRKIDEIFVRLERSGHPRAVVDRALFAVTLRKDIVRGREKKESKRRADLDALVAVHVGHHAAVHRLLGYSGDWPLRLPSVQPPCVPRPGATCISKRLAVRQHFAVGVALLEEQRRLATAPPPRRLVAEVPDALTDARGLMARFRTAGDNVTLKDWVRLVADYTRRGREEPLSEKGIELSAGALRTARAKRKRTLKRPPPRKV